MISDTLFKILCSFNFVIFKEIIEFPVLKLNGRTFEIEDTFHQYVQPTVHKQLTEFCTNVRHLLKLRLL